MPGADGGHARDLNRRAAHQLIKAPAARAGASDMATCWLCQNVEGELALGIARFMTENACTVPPEGMCRMVSESILKREPEARGARVADVRLHMSEHMLAPGYCVPRLLRQLLDLADKLHAVSVVQGEDGTTIENRSVQNYLKVVSEVMSIYKSGDPSKLAFGARAKPPSGS